MNFHECNLNIRYDLPKEILGKLETVYAQMDGWLGYGEEGKGYQDIPYWFSYNEDEKYILASMEPAGLHFEGNMEDEEWETWKAKIKTIATKTLGFKVGEIEEGDVGHNIEWL